MGVEVDESGGDVHARGVDDLGRFAGVDPADGGDLAASDADITAHSWRAAAVEDHSVLDDDVVFAHCSRS